MDYKVILYWNGGEADAVIRSHLNIDDFTKEIEKKIYYAKKKKKLLEINDGRSSILLCADYIIAIKVEYDAE